MRAIILCCLLSTSLAKPQGYNYPQGQQQNSFSIGLPQISQAVSSGSSSFHNGGAQEGLNFLQQAIQNPKVSQTLLGGNQQNFIQQQQRPSFLPQSFGPIQQYQQPQQQQYQQQQYQQQQYPQPPVVSKDIYVHAAPEEPEERIVQRPVPVPPPRKHYRIVFIKAPTQKASSAALRIQQAPVEEKTIIYVLTKKPDPIDLQTVLQDSAPKPPSKPEVYFIKYKTQEEAQHAQRTIQAEYDKLGGTTQISDEGVAPVTSVIGSVGQSQSSSGLSGSRDDAGISSSYGAPINTGSGSSGSVESKYLPPITRL